MFRCHLFTSSTSSISRSALVTTTFSFLPLHQKRFQSSAPSTEQLQLARVISTSKKLMAYMSLHKSNVNLSKRRIALQAWREIEELPQKYLEVADIDSVVKMLQVVSYFASNGEWENGHEGPQNPLPTKEAKKKMSVDGINNKSIAVVRDAEEIDIPVEFLYSGAKKAHNDRDSPPTNLRALNQKSPHQKQNNQMNRNNNSNASKSSGSGDVIGDMIE